MKERIILIGYHSYLWQITAILVDDQVKMQLFFFF